MDEIEHIWYVDEDTWIWLQVMLEEEPKVLPKLKELMSRRSIFDPVSEEHGDEQTQEEGNG